MGEKEGAMTIKAEGRSASVKAEAKTGETLKAEKREDNL
jgi:hypothetical protein